MIPFSVIATIHNGYSGKFGIPRQSGLANNLSEIVFEKEYRRKEALRGIEGYSHLWLVWYFSENRERAWTPTVRPPRLGGNKRMGVFATRSPYRPNPIGLSCVQLDGVFDDPAVGTVLRVRGADLMDGTPILDIKPYLPFSDCIPNAKGGFSDGVFDHALVVRFDMGVGEGLSAEQTVELTALLAQDPRPSYQSDGRAYLFEWEGYHIEFSVRENELTVHSAVKGADQP